jgi:hypothetical protein
MATRNGANRPELSLLVGAMVGTQELALLVAHKKLWLREISLLDLEAVVASTSNYVSAQLMVDGQLVGTPVSTMSGLAARQPLALALGAEKMILEQGQVASVLLTVSGDGELKKASLHADLEIVGN